MEHKNYISDKFRRKSTYIAVFVALVSLVFIIVSDIKSKFGLQYALPIIFIVLQIVIEKITTFEFDGALWTIRPVTRFRSNSGYRKLQVLHDDLVCIDIFNIKNSNRKPTLVFTYMRNGIETKEKCFTGRIPGLKTQEFLSDINITSPDLIGTELKSYLES